MGLRFFTIPIQDSSSAQAELNGFLSSHKVLAVERQWASLAGKQRWARLMKVSKNFVKTRNENLPPPRPGTPGRGGRGVRG